MSKKESTGKGVVWNNLIRSPSGSEYPLFRIEDHHKKNPRKGYNWRRDSRGEPRSEFGLSKSASRDTADPEESNTTLWWTSQEKKLAQSRNSKNNKIAMIENEILKKNKELATLDLVYKQLIDAGIEDIKFKKDINTLKIEIKKMEKQVGILNENIAVIEKQMSYIMSQDDIIIEERHINHEDDEKWFQSVIKKLPHLDKKYIKKRYNELIGIKGGVKMKSKKRMVQRKSKTRKVIKTKLKKTNKKFR